MSEPAVSDLEKERLLAEIGVEPSSVLVPIQPPPPPPPPPPAIEEPHPILDAPDPPPEAPAVEAPSRPVPAWWGRRSAAAGIVMAATGAAWTAVGVGFAEPLAGFLAALALGAGAAALLRAPSLPKNT